MNRKERRLTSHQLEFDLYTHRVQIVSFTDLMPGHFYCSSIRWTHARRQIYSALYATCCFMLLFFLHNCWPRYCTSICFIKHNALGFYLCTSSIRLLKMYVCTCTFCWKLKTNSLALCKFPFGAMRLRSHFALLQLTIFSDHFHVQLISSRVYTQDYLRKRGEHLSQMVMPYHYLLWYFAIFSHLWNSVAPSLITESCPTWLTLVCCQYTISERICSQTVTCEGPDEVWQCCRKNKVLWDLYLYIQYEMEPNP